MSATSQISKPSIVEERQKFIREQIHSRMNQRDVEWKQEVDQLRKQFFSDSSGVGLFSKSSSSSSNSFEFSDNNNNDIDRGKASHRNGNVRESVYSPDSIADSLFTPPLSPDFHQQQFRQQQNSFSSEHQQRYHQQQHQNYHQQQQFQEQQCFSPKTLSCQLNNFSNIADTKLRSNVISPTNIISNASIVSSSSSSSSSSSTSSLSPTLLKHEFDVKNFLPEEIKVTTERGKLIVCASHKETGMNKSVSREFKRTVDLKNHLDPSQLLCTLTKDGKLIVEIDKNQSSTKPYITVVDDEATKSTSLATKTFTPSIVDKYFNKDSTFVSTRFKPIETYIDKPLVQIPRHPTYESYPQSRQTLLQQLYSSDINTQTNSDFSSTASSFQFVTFSNDNVKDTAKDYLNSSPYSTNLKKVSLPDLVDDTNHYNTSRKSNNKSTYIEDCKPFDCNDACNVELFVSDTDRHNSIQQTHSFQGDNHYSHSSSPLDNLDNFSTILKFPDDQNVTTSEAGVTVIHSTNRPFHVGLNVGADVDPTDLKIDAVDRILLVRITNSANNYTNMRNTDKLNQSTRMWKIYLPDDLDPVNMNAHLTDEGELLLEESC